MFFSAWVFLICFVTLFVSARLGYSEPIPLWDGTTIDREVVGHSEKGLIIKTNHGSVRLRWDQVDRSFRLHPLHGRKLSYESMPESVDDPMLYPVVRSSGANRVTVVLFALFFWFWSGIAGAILLDREGVAKGIRRDILNVFALLFGLPMVIPIVIKRRGIGGIFSRLPAGAPVPEKHLPPCRFFTWDNLPIDSKTNRKLSSGLAVAEIVLARAVHAGASDVHFDTTTEGVRVAFRVDGVLRDPDMLEGDIGRKTISAIKMAAGMDLAQRKDAQDGACHLEAGTDRYDLRVATAWAVEGETLVVRLLRAGGLGKSLEDFGMLADMVRSAERLTQETAGIIILAGPTGSGKTTTIYALLRRIEGTGRNILTIEDPVEYRLTNATQISLNSRVGSTFASALKASMRHDPDVILVGEIRDSEAMDVAFQAALTGHLVFTTIHATSVLAAFGRLQELGLSAYMINTGLKAVLCQRLVRRLCPSCREAYLPDPEEVAAFGMSPVEGRDHLFYRPGGCRLCDDSGYHGRIAVYRMLCMDNRVRVMVKPDMNTGDLQAVVDQVALGSVEEYVREFLWTGMTSAQELMKTLDMFDFGKNLGGVK